MPPGQSRLLHPDAQVSTSASVGRRSPRSTNHINRPNRPHTPRCPSIDRRRPPHHSSSCSSSLTYFSFQSITDPPQLKKALRNYLTGGDATRYDQLPKVGLREGGSIDLCVGGGKNWGAWVRRSIRLWPIRLALDWLAGRPHMHQPFTTRHDTTGSNGCQGVVMVGVTHSNLVVSMPDIRLDLHSTVSAAAAASR